MGTPRLGAIAAAVSLALALAGCGSAVREVRRHAGFAAPPPSEIVRARAAWSYFEHEEHPGTASLGAGFATPASLGDELAATLAAWRLGLIGRSVLDARLDRLLTALGRMPLASGGHPGRFYDLGSGQLSDPGVGTPSDPGWSGTDLARLLVWLRVAANELPPRAAAITTLVDRWQLCSVVDAEGQVEHQLPHSDVTPEVGSGYAAYAALALQLWGVDAVVPPVPNGDFTVDVSGVAIPVDAASAREPVMTVPLALLAVEFGWQLPGGGELARQRALAGLVVTAQSRRAAAVGTLTARSDYRRAVAPNIVDDTVVAGNVPWRTLDSLGEPYPALALFSTRAAFAMRVLDSNGAYGAATVRASDGLARGGGYVEGRYENGSGDEPVQSAATNAFVLEAILFREAGSPRSGGQAVKRCRSRGRS